MQASPPASVHTVCSLGLEMLPSTFLSDDFSHICDRLKMAANPLIERWSLYLFTLNLVQLCDYFIDRIDDPKPQRLVASTSYLLECELWRKLAVM